MAAAESDRDRARRVLTALRALPPGALDALADHAVGPNADLLARVRGALAAPEPEVALAAALGGITLADATTLDPLALLAMGGELGAGADALRGELDTILRGRADLVSEGERLRAATPDAALVPLLEDALALLGEAGPFVALREAIGALGGVRALLASVDRGDVDLGGKLAELRARRDAIAGVAARLTEVPALLARARAYATERGDALASARLALATATLHDVGWPEVLALALAAEHLPMARAAATRIEGRALAAGQLDVVAETSAQIAALAARVGDPDAELAAVCAEALAIAQLPHGAAPAQALVARAHALGADAAPRAVRAQLLEGQVTELLGDDAAARRAFRSVMVGAEKVGLHHELGWAALHLGRLEAAQGHRFRAGQDLELAQDIGRTLGDSSLFGLAVAARIEGAADRAAATAVLAQGEVAPPALRVELQRRFETRWPAPS